MFCLNHRSIKVTLFSEIHIKIISKISLTYHQIAFISFSVTFWMCAYPYNTNFNTILVHRSYLYCFVSALILYLYHTFVKDLCVFRQLFYILVPIFVHIFIPGLFQYYICIVLYP